MSVDITVTCRQAPALLARAPFRGFALAAVSVDGSIVHLNCRPAALEHVMPLAELIAQAFDGVVELGGERPRRVAPRAFTPDEFAAAWRELDARAAAALAAAEAGAASKHATWEALDRAGPAALDPFNDWSRVMPRDRRPAPVTTPPPASDTPEAPRAAAPVSHAKFGRGTIVRGLEGDKIEVRFDSGETRTLARRFVEILPAGGG